MRWHYRSRSESGTALARRRRRTGAVLIVWVAVLSLAAGCGGGDDEVVLPGPDSPTPPLTEADYIKRANEICRAADAAIVERTNAAGPSGLGGNRSADEARVLLEEIGPIAEQAITKLKNLTPPEKDRQLLARVTEPMQQTLDRARREQTAYINPIRQVDPELYRYGLSGCYERG